MSPKGTKQGAVPVMGGDNMNQQLKVFEKPTLDKNISINIRRGKAIQ